MNAKSPKLATEAEALKHYLANVPDVSGEDLDSLRAAVERLDSDPEYEANYLKSRFVEMVLAAMEENSVSQAELAKLWGKTRQYVSKLLNEDRRVNFTIETMCEIASLLQRKIEINIVPVSEMARVVWTVVPPSALGAMWTGFQGTGQAWIVPTEFKELPSDEHGSCQHLQPIPQERYGNMAEFLATDLRPIGTTSIRESLNEKSYEPDSLAA